MVREKLTVASLLIIFALPVQAWWTPDTDIQWITIEVIPNTEQQTTALGTRQGTLLYSGQKFLAAIDDISGNTTLSLKSGLKHYDLPSGFQNLSLWKEPATMLFPAKMKSKKKKGGKKPAKTPAPKLSRIILLNIPDQGSNLCIDREAFGSTLEVNSRDSPLPVQLQIAADGSSVFVITAVSLFAGVAEVPAIGIPQTFEAIELHTDVKQGVRYFILPLPPTKAQKPEELAALNEIFEKFFITEQKKKDKDDDPDPDDGAEAGAISHLQ